MPIDRLTLAAGVGYIDFKYLNLSPIATAATGSTTYRPKRTTDRRRNTTPSRCSATRT